ncbi:uncharacterized protein ACO6RY_11857 [Pungitius sinensis]
MSSYTRPHDIIILNHLRPIRGPAPDVFLSLKHPLPFPASPQLLSFFLLPLPVSFSISSSQPSSYTSSSSSSTSTSSSSSSSTSTSSSSSSSSLRANVFLCWL